MIKPPQEGIKLICRRVADIDRTPFTQRNAKRFEARSTSYEDLYELLRPYLSSKSPLSIFEYLMDAGVIDKQGVESVDQYIESSDIISKVFPRAVERIILRALDEVYKLQTRVGGDDIDAVFI